MTTYIVDNYLDYLNNDFIITEAYLNEISLNMDKAIQSYKANIKTVKKVLVDHGLILNSFKAKLRKLLKW